MSRAQELISEVARWNPEQEWMKIARKLGGKQGRLSGRELTFEFPTTNAALQAAERGSKMGLRVSVDDEFVTLTMK